MEFMLTTLLNESVHGPFYRQVERAKFLSLTKTINYGLACNPEVPQEAIFKVLN